MGLKGVAHQQILFSLTISAMIRYLAGSCQVVSKCQLSTGCMEVLREPVSQFEGVSFFVCVLMDCCCYD